MGFKKKLLWIIIGIIFLEIALRVGGVIVLSMQRSENKITGSVVSDGQDGVYRILALGDSMTADSTGYFPWPRQLENILNNQSSEIKFKVFNEGITGTGPAFILANLKDNLERYNPDMVITMTGAVVLISGIKYTENLKVDLLLENIRVYRLGKLILAPWKKRLKDSEIIKFAKGEDTCEESVINEEEYQEYMKLGKMSWDIGEYAKAEKIFKKAININPENEYIYSTLGALYRENGEYVKAAEMFEKAIKINSENVEFYIQLMWIYYSIGKYAKATEMGEKAIKISPAEPYYLVVGEFYRIIKEYAKAEEMFKRAIKINPENKWNSIKLTWLYSEIGEYAKIEETYKKAGLPFKVKKNAPDIKRYHYRKLYEILNQQGIKYVAMQYPILNVEELKLMFDGNEDIIFVSNEENFKKVLKNGKSEDYFIDNFAGDFGHCTVKGNRLIAENVAEVILEELGIIK